MALGIVNTSIPDPVDAPRLRATLLDPLVRPQAPARILLEECPAGLLADLVREGFLTWDELAAAAERHPPSDHETAAWIRDMARLALVRTAAAGP
jgi:hypothetical protein